MTSYGPGCFFGEVRAGHGERTIEPMVWGKGERVVPELRASVVFVVLQASWGK